MNDDPFSEQAEGIATVLRQVAGLTVYTAPSDAPTGRATAAIKLDRVLYYRDDDGQGLGPFGMACHWMIRLETPRISTNAGTLGLYQLLNPRADASLSVVSALKSDPTVNDTCAASVVRLANQLGTTEAGPESHMTATVELITYGDTT